MLDEASANKTDSAKNILVRVSALAVLAAPAWITSARAQNLKLTCKQPIDIGNIIATNCAGSYVISPDGVHKNVGGCLVVNSAAQAGSCELSVTGGAATKSAVVAFTKADFLLSAAQAFTSVKMDSLRMKLRDETTIVTKLTLGTPTLASKVTIDIGGTLNFDNNQSAGSYSGQVSVSANF